MSLNTTRKTAIMQATLKLVAEQGFHNSPTAKIAKLAGTAEGTIFRHFGSKDTLLKAVFERELAGMREAISLEPGDGNNSREKFLAISTKLLDFYLDNPQVYHYFEQYLSSPFGQQSRQDALFNEEASDATAVPLLGLLEQASAAGEVRSMPRLVLLSQVIGPIFFYLDEVFHHGLEVDRVVFAQVVALCWESIKTPAVTI